MKQRFTTEEISYVEASLKGSYTVEVIDSAHSHFNLYGDDNFLRLWYLETNYPLYYLSWDNDEVHLEYEDQPIDVFRTLQEAVDYVITLSNR